jgi:hypothetical protein
MLTQLSSQRSCFLCAIPKPPEQAFSTYESRHDAKDVVPFARGINSFQLFFDGTRWWILTIYWQEEVPENPLPPEFLPHSR